MAIWRVRKIFKVPVGHRLSKHKGLCKNIHGHNLKLEVQISSFVLNDNDMVIDFKDIKTIVEPMLDQFDHAILVNNSDTTVKEFSTKAGFKTRVLYDEDVDPTAEVFAEYLFLKIQNYVNKIDSRLVLDWIRVWENDGSMTEYSE